MYFNFYSNFDSNSFCNSQLKFKDLRVCRFSSPVYHFDLIMESNFVPGNSVLTEEQRETKSDVLNIWRIQEGVSRCDSPSKHFCLGSN